MERRSFLKALGLATACVVISSPIDLLANPIPIEEKWYYFKISNTMMSDIPSVKHFVYKMGLDLTGDTNWEQKSTLQFGFIEDDFARDLQTVLIRYKA